MRAAVLLLVSNVALAAPYSDLVIKDDGYGTQEDAAKAALVVAADRSTGKSFHRSSHLTLTNNRGII
jgi:hypothetical protein